MNNLTYERIHHNLQELQLLTIEEILDAYLERASREGLSTLEVLDLLLQEEKIRKDEQKCSRRMKFAGFPSQKEFDDFDLTFQASVDPAQINELKTLRFIHNAENVVFLGGHPVLEKHTLQLPLEDMQLEMAFLLISLML